MIETEALTQVLATVADGDEIGWDATFEQLWTIDAPVMTALIQDIIAHGIQTPVEVGEDGRLWDGHHRVAAAVALGLTEIPVVYRLPSFPL